MEATTLTLMTFCGCFHGKIIFSAFVFVFVSISPIQGWRVKGISFLSCFYLFLFIFYATDFPEVTLKTCPLKKFILKYVMPLWFKNTVIGPEQGSASVLASRLPFYYDIGNHD